MKRIPLKAIIKKCVKRNYYKNNKLFRFDSAVYYEYKYEFTKYSGGQCDIIDYLFIRYMHNDVEIMCDNLVD